GILPAALVGLGRGLRDGQLAFGAGEPDLPALLHRPDETAADADDDDAGDGGQEGDQDGRGDRGGDADLVQGGDDAEANDEVGGQPAEERAVADAAEGSGGDVAHRVGQCGGDDHDDDGDDGPRQPGDDLVQQVADRVRAERTERELERDQQDAVVD